MINIHHPLPPPVPITVIAERYYVFGWGGMYGCCFSFSFDSGVFSDKQMHSGIGQAHGQHSNNTIRHTMDPFTAINLGLCTPAELNMPEGFKAFLNIIDPSFIK